MTDLLPWGQRPIADPAASNRGVHMREMLDELGPTFVKFGQLLSTRPVEEHRTTVSQTRSNARADARRGPASSCTAGSRR